MDNGKGRINFKLDKLLKERGIAKYRLHILTGINYDTIVKYCKGTIQRIHCQSI